MALLRLRAEELAQRVGKPPGVTGKNSVTCQAAGVQDRVCEVAHELTSVLPFETERKLNSAVDRHRVGNFNQDDVMALRVPKFFNLVIALRKIDGEACLKQGQVCGGRLPILVAAQNDSGLGTGERVEFVHREYMCSSGQGFR